MDFLSVADESATLYDAPSLKAKKIFVVSRYSPLEEVVNLSSWVKVRDNSGALAWIEKHALSSKRYVVVTVPLTDVHQAPDASSAVLAQVKNQVALALAEDSGTGWLKINISDSVVGYVKSADVWGN